MCLKTIKPRFNLFCSLIGPSHCHNTDDLLALTNPEVRKAFQEFLLPAERDRSRAHLVLAGESNTASVHSEPSGTVNTFQSASILLYSQLICGRRPTRMAPTPSSTVRPTLSSSCLPVWLVTEHTEHQDALFTNYMKQKTKFPA